jgi:hypothetical protein
MKPVVKLVMFVKKLYQSGLPNFQVPVLNGTWLQEREREREKKKFPCCSVTGRFHCTTTIITTNASLTSSAM